ncbi:hypothetical protein TNCV_1020511 [Trichonephila clavipes]|nr:hypothetical protein TNCV_1020511 [Trichonephila clavipes]
MCKVCHNCFVAKKELGESNEKYAICFEDDPKNIDINHSGSSTAMEMEAAFILWGRSQALGFRYSTLLSDGDSVSNTNAFFQNCRYLTRPYVVQQRQPKGESFRGHTLFKNSV